MRKMITILLLLIPLNLLAPSLEATWIERPMPDNGFEEIYKAICFVESSNNPSAYNPKENSIGIVQIRAIKVAEYNRFNKENIKHEDCYKPEISKKIFMWHCQQYGIRQWEKLIKRWNGSGSLTEIYLKKVKECLYKYNQ